MVNKCVFPEWCPGAGGWVVWPMVEEAMCDPHYQATCTFTRMAVCVPAAPQHTLSRGEHHQNLSCSEIYYLFIILASFIRPSLTHVVTIHHGAEHHAGHVTPRIAALAAPECPWV